MLTADIVQELGNHTGMIELTVTQREHLLTAYASHNVDARDVDVLLTVANHYAHHRPHPTIRELAEESGLSEYMVRKSLYRLRDAGVLTITPPSSGHQYSNAYHILDGVLPGDTPTLQEEEYRDSNGVLRECQHCGGPLTTNFHTETIIEKYRGFTEVRGRTENVSVHNFQHRHCWNCEVS